VEMVEAGMWKRYKLISSLPMRKQSCTYPSEGIETDFWAWSAERHGQYSVRSAYHLLANQDAQARAHVGSRPSNSNTADPMWKVLWKMDVSLRTVFWWRVINDFIPCRANLHRRHIEKLSSCEVCGAEVETTFHSLTECTHPKLLWREVHHMAGIKLPNLHPHTWARDQLDTTICNRDDACVILSGMWSLWCSWNDRRQTSQTILSKKPIK
jgi:hypothetical protein